MNFRTKTAKDIDLAITPLIDVVFLLLIFFMVTSTFSRETQISLDLPEAKGSQVEDQSRIIEVSVDDQGDIFVNAKPLINKQEQTLRRALLQVSDSDTSRPFVITGDANAPHQAIITVMDVAGQLGFSHIRLTTQQTRKAS